MLTFDVQPNTFTLPIDPIVLKNINFLGLSIKDFHVDIISFMDSLAPVIIQAESSLKFKNRQNTPGWTDIQKDLERSYRTKLGSVNNFSFFLAVPCSCVSILLQVYVNGAKLR